MEIFNNLPEDNTQKLICKKVLSKINKQKGYSIILNASEFNIKEKEFYEEAKMLINKKITVTAKEGKEHYCIFENIEINENDGSIMFEMHEQYKELLIKSIASEFEVI